MNLMRRVGRLFVCGWSVILLSGCDLDIDPDPLPEDAGAIPEVSQRRREPSELALRAGEQSLPKGTRTVDTHELKMENMGVTMELEGEVFTGSASINYLVERDVTVMFPSIWKIEFGEMKRTVTVKPRGQAEAEVMEFMHPLSKEVVIRDGDRFSIERAGASEAQEAALGSLETAWFGGDTLFADGAVRRRDDWAVKPEVILGAMLGTPVSEASGSAYLFLQKTLEFEDEKVAEVAVSIERCRGTMIDADGDPVEVELHGHGTLQRRLEPLHTTQVDLEGTAQVSMTKGGRKLTFNGPFKCRTRSRLNLP